MNKYFITEKDGVFLWDGKNLYHSNIVISEELIKKLPFYTGDFVDYYKMYVSDLTKIPTRKKDVDEKFIKGLVKRMKK